MRHSQTADTLFTTTMKNKLNNSPIERNVEIIIHICIWAYVVASPLIFRWGDETIDWGRYLRRLYFPLTSCVLFYLNYLWLVPRYVINKKYRTFILLNIVIVAIILFSRDYYTQLFPPTHIIRRPRFHHAPPSPIFHLTIQIRDAISLFFITLVALAVRLSLQWHKVEAARQKTELRLREAELQNIKNQINPHFLLNTLNNIYSLTSFDTERAQQAIEQLSHLLRYVLYENQAPFVDIRKEADFLKTYVSLMRIRLTENIDVSLDIDLPESCDIKVAPLIFISLVENAFKHGISPTKPSFIHIKLHASKEHGIVFSCINSNHPKNQSDKSPGGIGLKQVSRRLEHTYAGHYHWHYGPSNNDAKTYASIISIPPTSEKKRQA